MSHERTKPSAIVLDLLRSARGRERSARSLIANGTLFGFTENTLRVTLSRLLARGLIESPERGRYRLARGTDALNDFVERWRLGEARVRPWTAGCWLFAHLRGAVAGNAWALDALGFREVRDGLFARPDNLSLDLGALGDLAASLGLDAAVLLLEGRPRGEPIADGWSRAWHPTGLDDEYTDACARLARSAERLPRLPKEQAMLESFTLGGEMIHRLAKDPLLPAEMVDVETRAALGQAMLDYESLGQRMWARVAGEPAHTMPRPQLAMTN